MNALRALAKNHDTHKPTRETYDRFKEMLVKLMKRAPLSYTEQIFKLRERLDQAFRLRSSLCLAQLEKDINVLRGSI